jgi:hypothetical protein
LARGDTRIWGGGAIYAVGRVNFLFDRSQQPHHSADRLGECAGVVKTTMANKAALIVKTLDLPSMRSAALILRSRPALMLVWPYLPLLK